MALEGLISAAVFSMLPFSEMRIAIPLSIGLGTYPVLAFFVAVCFNILAINLVFLFLDKVHSKLYNLNFYSKLFDMYLVRVRRKAESKIKGNWPFIGLFFFIGLPFPGTGIWTASLISWFFKLDRRKSFITIAFGSILAGLIILLVTLGVISLF